MHKTIFVFLILFCSFGAKAQDRDTAQYLVIQDILIEGLKKTKKYIVLRELDFAIGDTILVTDLPDVFARNKKWFVNTDLFKSIAFNIGDWDFEQHQAVIKMKVQEAWYIYPIPLVDLADRNFNVWWDDHNHSRKRINVGLAYFQNNTTGRRDKLMILAQVGFTQKAEISYNIPYFNRHKTIGLRTKISFIRNKTIGYYVDDKYKEQFRFQEGTFLLRRFRTTADWSYRSNIRFTQTLLTGFYHNRISDFVVDSLNGDFFGNGIKDEKYPSVGYRLRYDGRDINLYTMEGKLIEFNVVYDGAIKGQGPDKWFTSLYYGQHFRLGKKWSTELIGKGVKHCTSVIQVIAIRVVLAVWILYGVMNITC